MRTIHFATLPKCDICQKNKAAYDAPTEHGSWAYMCEDCYKISANENLKHLGSKLEQRTLAKPKKDDTIHLGVEESTMQEIVMDGDRYVACPECGTSKHVEPDASYIFTCEGCGIKVRCQSIM